jgi:hypothetical protein
MSSTHICTHKIGLRNCANRSKLILMSLATRTAAPTNPLLNRAAVTNDPLRVRADGRTPQGKRIRDLYRSYWDAIGRPSNAAIQAAVLAASELMVAAEGARAEFLAGRGDVEQIVRLENLAARSVRRLGIKAGAAVAVPQTPAEYLARRAAERAGKPSGDPA